VFRGLTTEALDAGGVERGKVWGWGDPLTSSPPQPARESGEASWTPPAGSGAKLWLKTRFVLFRA